MASIIGYRGDGLTSATGTDPQTILVGDDSCVVDVNANQTNPNTYTTGGVRNYRSNYCLEWLRDGRHALYKNLLGHHWREQGPHHV